MVSTMVELQAKRSKLRQYVYCLLAYLPAIAPSASLGFSAVIIPILKTNFSIDEISWIASSAALASPVGCVAAGYISDKFGRIGTLQVINGVSVIGWSIVALAYHMENARHQYGVLLLGRIVTGLSTGLVSVGPIYLAEVSSTTLRPIFTTISSMFYSLGILMIYTYGYVLQEKWGYMAALCIVYPIISSVLLKLYLPESPVWLISKGRTEKAQENLNVIFGKRGLLIVKDELNTLMANHERGQQMLKDNAKRSKWQSLRERTVYYPFVVMLVYFAVQQFSGVMVIVFYAIDIAKDAQITADPYLVIIMIAITRVLTCLFVSLMSKRIGRRVTSLISGVGVTVTLYSLAYYIVSIKGADINQSSTVIPIVLIIFFIMLSTYGFLTIPFGMVAELFPIRVRGFMVGLTISVTYVMCFVATKMYPIIRTETENYWIFVIYGSVAAVGTVFLFLFLPETNGKSLAEIEELFRKK